MTKLIIICTLTLASVNSCQRDTIVSRVHVPIDTVEGCIEYGDAMLAHSFVTKYSCDISGRSE